MLFLAHDEFELYSYKKKGKQNINHIYGLLINLKNIQTYYYNILFCFYFG